MKECESVLRYKRQDFVETALLHFNNALDHRPPILVEALAYCTGSTLLLCVSMMLQPSLIIAIELQRVCVTVQGTDASDVTSMKEPLYKLEKG